MNLSNPLKVLMVGVTAPPPTFIARQISTLEELGIQVLLFPEFREHKYISNALADKGIFWHISHKSLALFQEADLIHFQWPGHLIKYYPLAEQAKKPVVVSLRGQQININPHLPNRSEYVRRLRRILPLCDAYHCVSNDVLRESLSLGLEPARARVIQPAVDTSFFCPAGMSNQGKPVRLLMVGALIWRKGYEYALLVLKRLVEAGMDVLLTIVGEGIERDRIEYTIQDLGLQGRVNLSGHITSSCVLELLHDSDIFVHTALSEGIANVVLEAMACELPVVSFLSGGMGEVIEHGRDGFLAQSRDVDEVVQYVTKLINQSELGDSIGKAARRKVQSKFELKDQGQKFFDLYKKMMEK